MVLKIWLQYLPNLVVNYIAKRLPPPSCTCTMARVATRRSSRQSASNAKNSSAARQTETRASIEREDSDGNGNGNVDDSRNTSRLAEISRQNAKGPHQIWRFDMCEAFILACLERKPWAAKHGEKAATWEAIKQDILSAVPSAHIAANQLSGKMKALLAKHVVSWIRLPVFRPRSEHRILIHSEGEQTKRVVQGKNHHE